MRLFIVSQVQVLGQIQSVFHDRNFCFFFHRKYVLQNGSLLIVEENFETYEVQSDYCLDEGLEGLYAIVCIQSSHTKQVRMLRGEAVIYAVCLWLSVPCLLVTAFFYLKIDSLRELHGRSLSA